ncbi:hypothetical protein VFPPC_18492 [Pochonia chlamydosporia 170]|uniref:Uncharacterized protein n=1 Tax=Pochonia chlamydosporia 170 TaxID=1380566 RepID=A0A219ANT3_METCM|nr:hypothetical protein VFPPC_18492 [Pochonia chlamydosporia 170]OWT42381.1 hypothetical protein VFPPC_18492 [Pochonia chlamydosporia 170]
MHYSPSSMGTCLLENVLDGSRPARAAQHVAFCQLDEDWHQGDSSWRQLHPRELSDDLPSILPGLLVCPQSPPESTSSGPRLTLEGDISDDCSPFPDTSRLDSPRINSLVRLPSLAEFDLGIEALARSYAPACLDTPLSPLPAYVPQDHYAPYYMNDACMHDVSGLDGYRSPPPDGQNRHINQKYTTEEGDFIIYAWYDKKLKWKRIKQDFATIFGRTPERIVQGLQGWCYRMNQRIPLWDQDGWLIFDNEDALGPKHISMNCSERDTQNKPMKPPGLVQRYPERALHYSWVDPEMKWRRIHQKELAS